MNSIWPACPINCDAKELVEPGTIEILVERRSVGKNMIAKTIQDGMREN